MAGPDIFISYAHVDNEPFLSLKKGWITYFVHDLQLMINRKIGRVKDYSLWQDYRLQGNEAITPEIETQVRAVKVLLVFLSPGWIESEWCQKELRLFCEKHDDVKDRIFVIELDSLQREEKPTAFHDLLGYPFWLKNEHGKIRQLGFPEPQATDSEYFNRLVDLSNDIANVLKNFKQPKILEDIPNAPKATIYVAPVNNELYDSRATLVNELKQYQIKVLPEKNVLITDIAAELDKCLYFVQLLSTDSMEGIPQKQFIIAEKKDKPILQWRNPQNLSTETINLEHQRLLEHKTVIEATLPDFIRMVREVVLPENNPLVDSKASQDEKIIFVHAGKEDYHHAKIIADSLREKGYGYMLSSYEGTPERIRKTIERGYQFCSTLLMLQQETPSEVVEDHLVEAQLHVQKRESKFDILLCRDPTAEALGFIPPNTKLFNCNSNFHEHCVEQFLQQVEA